MSFNLLGKEVSEQGSLDCPLQGFMGTYLPPSLADREQGCPLGARSLAFGTGNIQGGTKRSPGPVVTGSTVEPRYTLLWWAVATTS